MFRFRRVNIDGKSITETRLAGAELKPGELVKLEGGKFVKAVTADVDKEQLYIVNPAFHEGKTIADAIDPNDLILSSTIFSPVSGYIVSSIFLTIAFLAKARDSASRVRDSI